MFGLEGIRWLNQWFRKRQDPDLLPYTGNIITRYDDILINMVHPGLQDAGHGFGNEDERNDILTRLT